MTKLLKFITAVYVLVLVISLVSVGLYLQTAPPKDIQELVQLQSRKEDLLLVQDQLAKKVGVLNSTLNQEISNNVKLKSELSSTLGSQVALQESVANIQTPPSKPVVVPKRTTTRAS